MPQTKTVPGVLDFSPQREGLHNFSTEDDEIVQLNVYFIANQFVVACEELEDLDLLNDDVVLLEEDHDFVIASSVGNDDEPRWEDIEE